MINYATILDVLSKQLIALTTFLLACAIVALFYQDGAFNAFLITIALTSLTSFIVRKGLKLSKIKTDIRKKDGFIIVASIWVIFSLFGCLPYLLSGSINSFTDAFFETMSGFTTTGSSILNDIESLPKSILLWRSLTQWIGGMGIIVLFLAILPKLGVGGRELYMAEVPGPVKDKIKPRIRSTAQKLWLIYIGLTLIETILLYFGGMSFFDAINHSFTTISTGGYSTKQASVAAFNSPYIEYVISIFMILSGINFSVLFLTATGQFKSSLKDEELRWYLFIIIAYILLITFELNTTSDNHEKNFRDALFTVSSILTTTGYSTADYLTFPSYTIVLIFSLFFIGGSGGSTSGGVKIIRIVILIKNSFHELTRQVYPNAVIPIRYNNQVLKTETASNIISFLILYGLVYMLAVLIMSIWIPELDTVLSTVATSLANIGPGLGEVGPSNNFSSIPDPAKWFMATLMLLGRLELFTVLVLFTPSFWHK